MTGAAVLACLLAAAAPVQVPDDNFRRLHGRLELEQIGRFTAYDPHQLVQSGAWCASAMRE